jgi:cell division protein FtsB
VPEAKRPDPKRRSPASRPRTGDSARGRPRFGRRRGEPREPKAVPEAVTESIAVAAERRSEQRLGSTARRAAILAVVVCVLTLTIAGPVRTYLAQRTEMHQLAATDAQLRVQIAELEQQKAKLADPVFIAAQARERLGFVKPGDIPYQVQLPPTAAAPPEQASGPVSQSRPNEPWYTSLWRTIADKPHNISADVSSVPSSPAPAPPLPPGG